MRQLTYFTGAFLFLLIPLSGKVTGQNPLYSADSSYLARHDIVYKTPAYEGFEGFPVGNGDMGGMVWKLFDCEKRDGDNC